jgi:hypothetical protein
MRSIVLLAMMSGVAHATVVDVLLQRRAQPPRAPAEARRDPPRRMRVNGVELWLAVAESHAAPAEVRRFYEDSQILSFGDDNQGGLLAVDRANDAGRGRLLERIGRFLATDDLNELVRVQLVLLSRRPDGGTELVHVWPASPLGADALSAPPATVDGAEIPPGPPGFARVVSSGERGEPQALALYRGRASTSWILRWYRDRLPTDGWREDSGYRAFAARRGRCALRFHRRGQELYVDVDSDGVKGAASVCVIRMG